MFFGVLGDWFRLAHDQSTRYAHHGGVVRYVFDHHGVGTDPCIQAQGDGTQHLGSGPHDHTILKGGMAFALVPGGTAQGDAVVNGAVVSDFGGFADHHAVAVIDKKARAYGGAGMDLNGGNNTGQMGQKSGQQF